MTVHEKGPSKARQSKNKVRPTVAFQRVIGETQLAILYRAVDAATGCNVDQRDNLRKRVARLLGQTAELDLLLNYARAYTDGDMRARDRFIGVLNQLVHGGMGGAAGGGQPGARPADSDPAPMSGGPNRLRHVGYPCFVRPEAIGDVFVGLMSLCEISPHTCPDYVEALDGLLLRVARLEVLYAAAHDVHEASSPQTLEAFTTALAVVESWGEQRAVGEPVFFHLDFGNPDPLPMGLQTPRGLFDPCGLEKWARTREAVLCFKQLRDEPRYEIEDIVNLTRSDGGTISRRGCVGDLIEIRGSNLGPLATVVFPGGVRAADYPVNESDRVQCHIPAGALSGDIALRIPVMAPECTRFNVGRLSTRASNPALEIFERTIIDEFAVRGLGLRGTRDDDRVRLEACAIATLNWRVHNAARVLVTTSAGTLLWDSGEDSPRTVEHHIDVGTEAEETYTLEARGFCGVHSRTLTVETYRRLYFSESEGMEVQSGESVELVLNASCAAPAGGTAISLSSSNAAVLAVPPSVNIAAGASTVTFTATAATGCNEVAVTAEAADHERGEANVVVYSQPVIHSISPTSTFACAEEFRMTIAGDCFDEQYDANVVRATDGHEWIDFEVTGRSVASFDDFHGMDLTARARRLPAGHWDVYVTSHGLRSEPYCCLTATRDSAEITRFEASPDSIRYSEGGGTRVRLEWDVRYAKFVRLLSDVRGEVRGMDHYSSACITHGDAEEITINETHEFTLEAYTHADDSPVTRSLTVTARGMPDEDPPVVGFSSVLILNCHFEERPVTIYLLDLTAGTLEEQGELEAVYDSWGSCIGESMTIDLPDEHLVRIIAYDPGSPYCAPVDPTTPGCQRFVSRVLLGDDSGATESVTIS